MKNNYAIAIISAYLAMLSMLFIVILKEVFLIAVFSMLAVVFGISSGYYLRKVEEEI